MPTTNSLADFLEGIADAIRYAEGSSGVINAQNFEARIRALSGGGEKVTLTYTFNNEIAGNAYGTIYLFTSDSDSEGDYSLFWGNGTGVMSNYTAINTETITLVANASVGYTKLNSFNAIPKYATRVYAVKNGTIKATYEIPSAKLWNAGNYGEHLYSVGLLSDVHYQYNTGSSDWSRALIYFNDRESVVATCISGDLTSDGTLSHLNEWKTARDNASPDTPVYASNGNHESKTNSSYMVTNPTAMRPFLDTDTTSDTSNFFYKIIEDDVYIFVPIFEGVAEGIANTMFSDTVLAQLENVLETYRNQRVFVFQHVPPYKDYCPSGFGTGNGAYAYNVWGKPSSTHKEDRQKFLELMAHYKNAIWFSGHSHIKYVYQETWANLNICQYNTDASRFVHISSLTVPRDIIDGSVSDDIYAESEGAVMDVYENCVILRSRDFENEQFIGIASYLVDTTPKTIPPKPTPSEKTLVSISATKTKTTYNVGETFSTADVTVTAHYDDSTTAEVTSSATIGTVDTSTVGSKTLNISYTEDDVTETTTIAIVVQQSGGSDIEISYTIEDKVKIDSSTGAETRTSHYGASDYIPIVAGATYTFNLDTTSPDIAASNPSCKIAYYSGTGGQTDFIECTSEAVVNGTTKSSGTFTPIANATHFRLRAQYSTSTPSGFGTLVQHT